MTKIITSLQNPIIKNVLLLEEKPRERKVQNLIVIEGFREVKLALTAGFTITTIFYCKNFIDQKDFNGLIANGSTTFEMVELPGEIYNRIAYRKDHGGVIALANPKRLLLKDLR
ncbi:MAG: RNA methyltransferase substrate-binding domain-containing protein, partial [Bacteroidota bacterium]